MVAVVHDSKLRFLVVPLDACLQVTIDWQCKVNVHGSAASQGRTLPTAAKIMFGLDTHAHAHANGKCLCQKYLRKVSLVSLPVMEGNDRCV